MSTATITRSAGATGIARGRTRRARRVRTVTAVLALLVIAVYCLSLMVGKTFYSPDEVWRVIIGEQVRGATFTVGVLRLPRATMAVLTGFAFGIAGAMFQTMLRNALASPDVIGISTGASAAAVYAIVILKIPSATTVSLLAIVAALATSLAIYLLAYRNGMLGSRLILIGIGVAAMLESVVSYVIIRAASWDLQTAMRWLTGSLNSASWKQVQPLLAAVLLFVPLLLVLARNLEQLRLGNDTAAALGVPVERTRLAAIIAATALIAFATAAAGPIAFVAFLSGPIAARLVGTAGSLLVPAGLVGSLLVLVADLVAQYAFGTRYPVGVITGALGAPYLVFLLIRINRAGGSL
ncbi:iron chelate uptake ABC transporter family permease subunit [Actinoplanes hulinensis]|uniref:Iron chelate uptake ABC transporter family permease subunit n=1 Tax=Actinoplanes hulinensis TaxID=1144547 RepID=A0ABS7BH87_9ACTN|nr:iron chelate uptake ABC transporter family permease subunit [Actinoplanes hulinensis]MBW6440263.1 iron chelate uptake ABC transporter family permease subunit [Actinoplanes hulinensis]